MNHIYRLVWSEVLNAFVAVAEFNKTRGKRSGKAALTLAAIIQLGVVQAADLPENGHYVLGVGNIATSGNTMTVTQSSNRAVIDWQSFSIGNGYAVNFVQPSSLSVALNRVLGSDVSVIQGSLTSNGQVFLINPNGVLFTSSAQVNVGGLLASTLNISNEDFMSGNYDFSGSSTAAVRNKGRIKANDGGTITLIAARIENAGEIAAHKGNVLMGAGQKVHVDLGGPVKIEVEEGAINALIDQAGAIRADGGTVYLTAKAADSLTTSVINHTGITEARTLATGEHGDIRLMGDMHYGTVNVGGVLDASAPDGGNGGFIETSAAHVKVADNAHVTTKATSGITGTWLIDPDGFTVAASGGDMTGTAVSSALASNNFVIQSINGNGTSGNIDINDTVSWNANILTLSATNNININAAMNGSGTAGLALEYGQGAVAAGNTATYSVNAPVNLASTGSFSTKLGSNGATINYTILNSLGAAGSVTGTDLQGMSGNLAGNYVLGSDIDATATSGWNGGLGFNPVGNTVTKFTGRFDGLGHTVQNLTIQRPSTSNVGLFGRSNGATFRNVNFNNANIRGSVNVGTLVGRMDSGVVDNSYASGTVSAGGGAGGMVGYAAGSVISNSHSDATVDVGAGDTAGGLVGTVDYGTITRISNSSASGSVSGRRYIGGLVGFSGDANIIDSYATGNVHASFDGGGGLVGYTSGSNINNSYATGSVTGDNDVGGLIGISEASTVSNSYAIGNVTGNTTVGGLIGYANWQNVISNNHATGTVTGHRDVGGLAGVNWNSIIENSYSSSTVTGVAIGATASQNIGGLVGTNDILSTINNSHATGNVTGTFNVGGLAGRNLSDVAIESSYATGKVTGVAVGVSNSNAVGGLVGFNGQWGIINNSHATGAVSGFDSVGGLLGMGNRETTITNSHATGNVAGSLNVGGLVGYIGKNGTATTTSLIQNSYATGDVNGSAWAAGGLVGYGTYVTVDGSHASGKVTGSELVGGLLGYGEHVTVNNSYAEGDVVGGNNTGGLVGGVDYSTISNSYRTKGSVAGANYVGGLAGFTYYSTVSASYATSLPGNSVTGSGSYVGGLVGLHERSTIDSNSYASSNVVGLTNVGGLVGYSDTSNVYDSHATGNASGTNNVGGLVGGAIYTDIYGDYATGNVNASSEAGGLVGNSFTTAIGTAFATGDVTSLGNNAGGLVGRVGGNSSVMNAYAAGKVHGNAFVGGLAGLVTDTSMMSRTYAVGQVTATAGNVGGLVGGVTGSGSVSNSFWDVQTSGIGASGDNNSGATGKTTVEMKTLSTFSSAGWDVDDVGGSGKVWRHYEGDAYPLLRYFMTPLNIAASSSSKVYDGVAYTGAEGFTYGGPHDPTALIYSGTAVGAKNVGNYNNSAFSRQLGYDLIGTRASTLSITPRSVTVVADAKNKTYGALDPMLTYTSNCGGLLGDCGLVSGESLNGILNRVAGENVGNYGIQQGSITDANNTNYQITYLGDNLSITPRPVTVVADAKNKTYGALDPMLTYTTNCGGLLGDCGLVSGESLNGILNRVAGENVGNYGIQQGSITDANNTNYQISYLGADLTVTAVVTPDPVTPDPDTSDPDPAITDVHVDVGIDVLPRPCFCDPVESGRTSNNLAAMSALDGFGAPGDSERNIDNIGGLIYVNIHDVPVNIFEHIDKHEQNSLNKILTVFVQRGGINIGPNFGNQY